MIIFKKKIPKKKVIVAGIVRAEDNPIILPVSDNGWETWQTFNPGVILLEDKAHFVYRAIGDDGNFRRKNCLDNWIRGAGAPPLRTKSGWLLFYHAVDNDDPGKYKIGALLLDLNDPTKTFTVPGNLFYRQKKNTKTTDLRKKGYDCQTV